MNNDVPMTPRPVGPVGLLLSIFALVLLAVLLLAVGVAVAAAVDWAILGWPHLVQTAERLRDARLGARAGELETAGFLVGSAIYFAVILAIWVMARLRAGASWPVLVGWARFRPDWVYWSVVLGAIVYGVLASALIGFLHPASREWFTLPKAPVAVVSSVLLVAVLAPLAEELFFRGWVYTALRWRYSYPVALTLSSVFFAGAHWERTHLYAIAVLPIGFALGYIRERTGSTRATTLFHALYNLSGWLLTFLGKA